MIVSSSSGSDVRTQEGSSHFQRQGSLTLPRILSEDGGRGLAGRIKRVRWWEGGQGGDGFGMLPREPTLGEVTPAGVVKEETQPAAMLKNIGVFYDWSIPTSSGSEFGYQQTGGMAARLMVSRAAKSANPIPLESVGLPLNVIEVRSASPQPTQQQQLLPKQPGFALGISSNQLGNSGIRCGIVGVSDAVMNNYMVQNLKLHCGGLGMVNLNANEKGSSSVSSDGQRNSNGFKQKLRHVVEFVV